MRWSSENSRGWHESFGTGNSQWQSRKQVTVVAALSMIVTHFCWRHFWFQKRSGCCSAVQAFELEECLVETLERSRDLSEDQLHRCSNEQLARRRCQSVAIA